MERPRSALLLVAAAVAVLVALVLLWTRIGSRAPADRDGRAPGEATAAATAPGEPPPRSISAAGRHVARDRHAAVNAVPPSVPAAPRGPDGRLLDPPRPGQRSNLLYPPDSARPLDAGPSR